MASGLKEGPAPDRIYVIKDQFEIRYYTTPEAFATAIAKGYAPGGREQLVVYQQCEMQADLEVDRLLSQPENVWPQRGLSTMQIRDRIKRLRPLLVKILERL